MLERRLSVARPGLPARSPRRPGRRWAVPPRDASPGERFVDLTVILSGRVLAFEWPEGGFLFRAGRQTVVRVDRWPDLDEPDRREDLGGHLARLPGRHPFGAGPVRLALPEEPSHAAVSDDAGWCQKTGHPSTV